jgi:hypothetical protein
MEYIKTVGTHNYTDTLFGELLTLIKEHDLNTQPQISLTSIDGDNDWYCSIGRIHDLPYREKLYSKINKSLEGTNIHKLIEDHPQYYRWRAMKMQPHKTYTIHKDGQKNVSNIRCHIPVVTNPQAYHISFGEDKSNLNPKLYHMECGKIYEVNTTQYHSAINFGGEDRWHLLGVKYEDSNYWT